MDRCVLEQHVDEGISEERETAHRLRPRHRQHGRRERIGDLVLHDLGSLSWKVRAQNHLDVRQIREGIDRCRLDSPDAPGCDEHRRQQHQKAIANRPADDDTGAVDSGLDLERLLAQLPAKTRRTIRLVKLDGFSTEDAAARSGSSLSAVKVSVHRGLRALSLLVKPRNTR